MRVSLPATIGVISDTHGTLNPGVLHVFDEVDLVVHAGDIGSPAVLAELEAIAPTVAVRGNTDHGAWATTLPDSASVLVGDVLVWAVHEYGCCPVPTRAGVVITGHTHRPAVEWVQGILYLNSGSASQPCGRVSRPTVALLELGADSQPAARIHRL